MKKLLIAIAALGLVGTPALAADMAVKAPLPPPAPVYSWTGFYVGGNIGGSWGDANTDLAGTGSFRTPVATTFFGFVDSNKARLDGVIGGGQLGYNYQFSPQWVLGFEADIQGSGERGSSQSTDLFTVPLCLAGNGVSCLAFGPPIPATALTGYQAKIDWFGTVRGRLGFLVGDQLLVYGTGGLAYGRVAVSGNTSVNTTFGNPAFGGGPITANAAFANSRTNTGFSVGAGAEGRFSYWLPPNWTWRVEYLYLDLGSLNTTTTFAAASKPTVGFLGMAGTMTTHTHFTDNILRVGLNYQFH
jgi:outer membrane immunogenic protein